MRGGVTEWFFFFQAEDGIRDLVRSRGLGDVYKRQDISLRSFEVGAAVGQQNVVEPEFQHVFSMQAPGTVSYTHLTLPTSDLV